MTTAVSVIVLPDDPSFGPEVQVDYPGYRSTRLRAHSRIIGSDRVRQRECEHASHLPAAVVDAFG